MIKNIKQKFINNQSIITKTDKGNTLTRKKNNNYINEIENFINNNNFTILSHDITNKQQHNIRYYINNTKNIIKSNNRDMYI
jgi:GTP-binding protein EngB required for normal cell division